MHPKDATEGVYRGSAAHISTFLWRYAPQGCHRERILRVAGAYLTGHRFFAAAQNDRVGPASGRTVQSLLQEGQCRACSRKDSAEPAPGMTKQDLPGRTVTAGVLYNKKNPEVTGLQDFALIYPCGWWEQRESNPRPSACKADALNQLSYAPF